MVDGEISLHGPVLQDHNDASNEQIKLVIWDLDETFWRGTLSEGGITPIQANIDLIKELSARGIVNSVCSKNAFEAAKEMLVKLGVWEFFVFPKIEFGPKGSMLKEIIEAVQLRPASVLFIDDNVMNLNEALHYNPGMQVSEPSVLASLLDDWRCNGKPDPNLQRLERYKVLEQKYHDQKTAGGNNLEFLKTSGIRISFHHNVMDEFTRIHDLVNRSNQLNFTKKRWPEDEVSAREVFAKELSEVFDSHAGYVKVSDRYGNYGICGFYLSHFNTCYHFLFSCRAMNMGIEQFVWHKLNRPKVEIVGDVVSSLDHLPDWITVVDDADDAPIEEANTAYRPVVCVRGACDLSMMAHYLRTRFDTIEEFQFPYQGWGIHPVARVIALEEEVHSPDGQALIKKLPGMPPKRFESAINDGSADVYVLSFSSEFFPGLQRSRSTGMIFPFHNNFIGNVDYNSVSYETILQRSNGAVEFSASDWAFMQDEFEYVGFIDEALLAADISKIFKKLEGKIVIVLMLNTQISGENAAQKWILNWFAKINSVVLPLVNAFGYYKIDVNEFVCDVDDLVDPLEDPGVHYKREVYMKLAERVAAICTTHGKSLVSSEVA